MFPLLSVVAPFFQTVTFLIFRFGGMTTMSLCEELDSEDSGASVSSAAAV